MRNLLLTVVGIVAGIVLGNAMVANGYDAAESTRA